MAAISQCSFTVSSVVRGHHIYKAIWTPFVGEELVVKTEDENEFDRHAVAVVVLFLFHHRSITRAILVFQINGGRGRLIEMGLY